MNVYNICHAHWYAQAEDITYAANSMHLFYGRGIYINTSDMI